MEVLTAVVRLVRRRLITVGTIGKLHGGYCLGRHSRIRGDQAISKLHETSLCSSKVMLYLKASQYGLKLLWGVQRLCESLGIDYLQPGNSPGKNTGVGGQPLLQGVFLTKGLNLGVFHCRQILYHLSHHGCPNIYIKSLHISNQILRSSQTWYRTLSFLFCQR